MDNVLIQARGEKALIFYSPFDAEFLYLEGAPIDLIAAPIDIPASLISYIAF